MRRFQFGVLLIALFNACGCASLYLHDENLAAQTSSAKTQLEAVSLDAPFNAELEYIDEFGRDRELALVEFGVSERDRQFALILENSGSVAEALEQQADFMLGQLFCSEENAVCKKAEVEGYEFLALDDNVLLDPENELLNALVALPSEQAFNRRLESSIERQIDRFANQLRRKGKKAPSCESLFKKETPKKSGEWLALANEVPDPDAWSSEKTQANLEARIYLHCGRLRDNQAIGSPLRMELNTFDGDGNLINDVQLFEFIKTGQLGVAIEEYREAKDRADNAGKGSSDQEIAALIKEAKKAVESSSDDKLKKARADLVELLGSLSGLAKEAAWDRLETEIDGIIKAEICGSNSQASDEAKAEAKCEDVEEGSTTEKADVIWELLDAVASLKDIRAQDGRNANWLLAAKAIANANVEDAKLVAQRDRRIAEHLNNRMRAVAKQASAAACMKLAVNDLPCSGLTGPGHALSSFADTWNGGSIPASIYADRAEREERIAWVLRSQAVADRQIKLITSAINQLDDLGQTGLKAELIARMINSFALLDIAGDE